MAGSASRAGAIATVVAAVLAAASFASTYIYATKTELADVRGQATQGGAKVREDVAGLRGEIRVLDSKVTDLRTSQRSLQKTQHDIDENLRRLLLQNRVSPVPRTRRR